MHKPSIASPPPFLTGRERDTVLAALRLWQATAATDINGDILAIAAGAYEHPPLDGSEIDALCERLNVEQGS